MPDGVVQWFDPSTGEGRILHAGRRYAVEASQIERKAQVPGARVHFDIDHDAAGDVATDAVLLPGTRISPRQRRFGDLIGARAPDTKGTAPYADEKPELGRDREGHPKRVAERWSALLSTAQLDDVTLLYAPDASLHVAGEVLAGPERIRTYWAGSPLLGGPRPTSVDGQGDTFRVRWPAADEEPPLESHLRISHGEIAEQWHGAVWMIVSTEGRAEPIEISTDGDVSEQDQTYAVDKIAKVVETMSVPVLHTNLRLRQAPDPARERPALADVGLDVDGAPVHARVAAHTMTEAIDLLEQRLSRRVSQQAELERTLRRRGPSSPEGQWRHGDAPSTRPPWYPRPVEEREVVRRPTLTAPEAATIDEAVFDLETLDDEFLLFRELSTDQDALVWRRPDGSYGLQFCDGAGDREPARGVAAVEFDEHPAPRLLLDEARELLEQTGDAWLFFADAESDRGQVLYRRYDGHDGLVVTRDEE